MKKLTYLSETEMEIMVTIWELDRKFSAKELLEIFHSKGKTWKKTTLQTFLTRLIKKGVLKAELLRDRTLEYEPAMNREEYEQTFAQNILNTMYDGSVNKFLAALSGGRELTGRDNEELQEWLRSR